MTELSSDIDNVIVQIATPWGGGMGFYLYDYNLIVARLSEIHQAKEMVIKGKLFPKTITKRLYIDSIHNLVFLEAPEGVFLPKVDIEDINLFTESGESPEYTFELDSLKKALDKYKQYTGVFVLACSNCSAFITEENINDYCCPDCGAQVSREVFDGKKYEPSSTGVKIEEIIRKLNYEVAIARIDQNYWEIDEGSALICVKNDVDEQFVKAYAVLCKLPKEKTGSIYEYLLKENNYLKGLSFSVVGEEVILSVMHISEEDLHVNSAVRLFKSLFNKADDYDDILIEMGAIPLHSDE